MDGFSARDAHVRMTGVSGPGRAPPFLHSPLAPFLWVWACLTMRESAGGASSEVRRPVIRDTAIAVVRSEIETYPTAFFTTIPSSTRTALLVLRMLGNLPLPSVIPSSTHLVVLVIQVSGVVDTGVRCQGIWNLCGVCCFYGQCWMCLSPLSPGISGLHFPPSSQMELGLTTFP
jgi:hypothetical protein